MKTKLYWVEALLLALPFAIMAITWHALPERAPIHWNVDNEIDAWGTKGPSLFLTAFLAMGVAAPLHLLPGLDRRLWRMKDHGRMEAILPIFRVSIIALLDAVFLLQIAASLGWQFDSRRIVGSGLLLLFLVLGNYLPNIRPNYFVGIRTPWTLENSETWRATHRLGGRLIFFGALLLLIAQFLLDDRIFVWLVVLATLGLVVWAFLYSWHRSQTHATIS